MELWWQEHERNQVRHLLESHGALHAFGQRVATGVIAEGAFLVERLARVNLAFNDEIGVGGE
jgi:hypothetical protein